MKFKKKTGDSADLPKTTFGEQSQMSSCSTVPDLSEAFESNNSNLISNNQQSKQSNFGFITRGTISNIQSRNYEYNSISKIQQPENNSLNLSQTFSNITDDATKTKISDYLTDNNAIENDQTQNYDQKLPNNQYDYPFQIPNYDEVINYNNSNLNNSQISESNSNTIKKAIVYDDSDDTNKLPINYKSDLFGLNMKSKQRVIMI